MSVRLVSHGMDCWATPHVVTVLIYPAEAEPQCEGNDRLLQAARRYVWWEGVLGSVVPFGSWVLPISCAGVAENALVSKIQRWGFNSD